VKRRHVWVDIEHRDEYTRRHCAHCNRQSERRGRWRAPVYWNGADRLNASLFEGHCEPKQDA
jgi:hypothetical protein